MRHVTMEQINAARARADAAVEARRTAERERDEARDNFDAEAISNATPEALHAAAQRWCRAVLRHVDAEQAADSEKRFVDSLLFAYWKQEGI